MPRRDTADEFSFDIYVDPSCLGEPMEESKVKGQEVPDVEVEKESPGHATEATNEQRAELETNADSSDDDDDDDDDDDEEGSESEPEAGSEDASPPEPSVDQLSEDQEKAGEESTPESAGLDAELEASLDGSEASEDSESDHIEEQTVTGDDDDGGDDDETHDDHGLDTEAAASESRRESGISCSSCAVTDDDSYISHSQAPSTRDSDAYSMADDRRLSMDDNGSERTAGDEGGDSSSHHENDDDVFSDHSPRSSMGSVSENDHRKPSDVMSNITTRSRISRMSRYDREDEDFVPTIRGTPRPAFRSPSSVKAMQMSSPAPSVMGSSRSSRRTPLPTISRLGSPTVSAQYSPKRTPPRFKRDTPPLVLLHVTLLPLRWVWGDVLNNARSDELSRDGKTVRDAWNQLQDRMGDTTCERGILLPHPQSDYEILEERLLEALELPMRRRARILECGHYLGPSNEFSMMEDSDSEEEEDYDYDDDSRSNRKSLNKQMHWCTTCRSDIRYESLGPGKIFRVKVYASNGLMKGGAWEACWKEMERVDVELEPIVEPAVQEELERLAAEQDKAMELHEGPRGRREQRDEYEEEPTELHHDEDPYVEPTPLRQIEAPAPQAEAHMGTKSGSDDPPPQRTQKPYHDEDPHHDDQPHTEQGETPPGQEHMPHATPGTQESTEAFERREAYKDASLPQLIAESVKVLMQDKKNIIIFLLSALVVMIAVRGNQPMQDPRTFQTLVTSQEMSTVAVTHMPAVEAIQTLAAAVESSAVADEAATTSLLGVELAASEAAAVEEAEGSEASAPDELIIETQVEELDEPFATEVLGGEPLQVDESSAPSETKEADIDADVTVEEEASDAVLEESESLESSVAENLEEEFQETSLEPTVSEELLVSASVTELLPKETETITVTETIRERVTDLPEPEVEVESHDDDDVVVVGDDDKEKEETETETDNLAEPTHEVELDVNDHEDEAEIDDVDDEEELEREL